MCNTTITSIIDQIMHEAIVDEETWQAAQQIFHPEMSSTPGKPEESVSLANRL